MKKQYMNYMKSCLLVMIACLVSMVGAALGFSPAAMEQLKTRRLWSHSQNAAGMPFEIFRIIRMLYWDMTYRTETIAVRKRGRKRLS